jgi:hypothetical protein
MNINIIPKDITTTITNITIEIMSLNFNSSATFRVNSISNMHLIKSDIFIIQGEEYENWGNNDDYIINLLLGKLGYTKS